MTGPRPPLAATDTWHTVMTAAGHRCHCTGQCGSRHSRTQGRCDHTHGGYAAGTTVRLLAAPADPAQLTLPAHQAARLAPELLAAWCPACHNAALTRTTRRTADVTDDDGPALF